MLFRNLPRIEPSPEFSKRLETKLREAKLADEALAHSGRSRRFTAAAVSIASAAMLTYIGISLRQVDTPQDIVLPPVVAIATTSDASSGPAPEMIAAVSAGVPIWTAALFAEQTTAHFASIELASSMH
jgi:hypothetical protein